MVYAETNGVWQHHARKSIFVGDYIDRGPEIRETLELVKAMVDHGKAIPIMGNHEYNALAYWYQRSDGRYLRSHNDKHTGQHKETIKQFEGRDEEWKTYLDWFYTLPLFLDLGSIRVVHACWDDGHMQWLKETNNTKISEAFLVASHDNEKENQVINDVLKGTEVEL